MIRAAGESFLRAQPEVVHLAASESAERHPALPHRRARRTCGCVFRVRTSGHLLQLVPQPALPEVSGQRARPLARSARQRTAAHALRPRGLHVAAPTFAAGACRTRREIYALLFRASAETLLEVARDPKHLGAEIGFFSVLHTWNQKLQHHPHVHCVVPAGGSGSGSSRDGSASQHQLLPAGRVLSEVFRGKFVDGLRELHAEHKLGFHGDLARLQNPKAFAAWLRPLFRSEWVVYSKRPFGGAQHALRYLGHYTHRVAISNHRLVALADGMVTFRWRDSAHKNKKRLMTLPRRRVPAPIPAARAAAGIRPHPPLRVLRPSPSRRLAPALLPTARRHRTSSGHPTAQNPHPKITTPLWICPRCGGPMVLIERLTPTQARLRSPPTGTPIMSLIRSFSSRTLRVLRRDCHVVCSPTAASPRRAACRPNSSASRSPKPFTNPSARLLPCTQTRRSPFKTHSVGFQTASFKSLYRKRSGDECSLSYRS